MKSELKEEVLNTLRLIRAHIREFGITGGNPQYLPEAVCPRGLTSHFAPDWEKEERDGRRFHNYFAAPKGGVSEGVALALAVSGDDLGEYYPGDGDGLNELFGRIERHWGQLGREGSTSEVLDYINEAVRGVENPRHDAIRKFFAELPQSAEEIVRELAKSAYAGSISNIIGRATDAGPAVRADAQRLRDLRDAALDYMQAHPVH